MENTDKNEISDELLAISAQNGNNTAFAELVDRYQGKLLRYARRFLRNYNSEGIV